MTKELIKLYKRKFLGKCKLRMCLVRVKAFPENISFSGNAIFRKGKCFYVFGCILKNFLKNIFWCLENATRKRQTHLHPGQNPD